MSQIGSAARDYYRDYLPGRYTSITGPQEHFSQLGQHLRSPRWQGMTVEATQPLSARGGAGSPVRGHTSWARSVKDRWP
jgi:hypothetical protein